ncbi:FMN-binding glutamate synthase family protein [Saprospira grandis]|uniref:Glutamate synthase (NADPH) n=1 Tax=Saprospira grandis (strain Lewin) TaxID=984262 RepID=H6L811_SAPGL|nr:FMN-binding glutamate synthase family protein [Saprospira grandis]AFC25339.1 Glutamate synthase (NADPH) [Saprospira grandis str. Lewin]
MTINNFPQKFLAVSLLLFAATAIAAYFLSIHFLWALVILLPLFFMGLQDMIQTDHAIRKTHPLIGRMRYFLEGLRPAIRQYFIESDLDHTPFSRRKRSLIYQRAKKAKETVPFGTQLDIYDEGYEWMTHSTYPFAFDSIEQDPKVSVGGPDCSQPYDLSIFNISAMSFGSLSANAVMAMNKGAAKGGFAQNTGEGGVSPYHLSQGGHLIWQIGTGYFGCRADDGNFDPDKFAKTVDHPDIKMVEIKLSQGAKPGHGGILPAKKNTAEIAKIRGVQAGTDVLSPPYHKAFQGPEGLLQFVAQLRQLSKGRPIGFKLCIGSEIEFYDLCKAMVKTGIKPDFITIDGGEGGTGAAPVEFSDSLGMPLRDGLSFAVDTLRGFDLKKDIKVLAAGKISCGFDLAKTLALGADACYSARAMMMAVGCIQALECHTNKCPTGVATQNKQLMKGLNVPDKAERIYSFHKKTVHALVELLAAAGMKEPSELSRKHILRRISMSEVRRYDQLYPEIPVGCLLQGQEGCLPDLYRKEMLQYLEEGSNYE